MSNYEEYGSPLEDTPLLKFEADLNWVDNYGDMMISFHDYLVRELEMSDAFAANIIASEHAMGVFPSEAVYDRSWEAAHDQLRMVFYKVAMPLYESMHTREELDIWMPLAMRTVVNPDESAHKPSDCLRQNDSIRDECPEGHCPLKLVERTVVSALTNADFSELDYFVDPKKQVEDRLRRLDCAVNFGIIGRQDAQVLTDTYLDHFDMCFPGMP